MFFTLVWLRLVRWGAFFPASAEPERRTAAHAGHEQQRPGRDRPQHRAAHKAGQPAPAALRRLHELRAKARAAGNRGQRLHLAQRYRDGCEIDQVIVTAFFAGQAVDLIFAIRQGVFQRDDVFHLGGLAKQLHQPLMLGLQRGQARFDIGVLLGHILAPAARRHHMAGLAELGEARLEFPLRHAQRIAGVPAAQLARHAARLDIAARAGCQRFDIRAGLVERLRLQRQIRGQDELCVLPHRGKINRPAALRRRGRALRPAGVVVLRRRRAAGSVRATRRAAGRQRQQQDQRRQQRKPSSFHIRTPLSLCWLSC